VVLGGSQGASPLNGWARQVAEALAQEGVQLYCVAGLGKSEAETVSYRSKSGDETKAVFVPFCDQIAAVLSAADLVVSRAGAGTLAELVRCEVPAILVPYPHAASDHQRANAAFFERQGGGIVVEEASIQGLLAEALEVVFNDWLLRQFRGNLRRMDRSNSLDLMLADLESMARSGSDGRMGRALRAA
jgi:UDP-N-acetylglucosamine--N-acetylmuramyl-(pentapeptide) pyrophosphoryl-undecaprenol N-acetylglucosamine transferase